MTTTIEGRHFIGCCIGATRVCATRQLALKYWNDGNVS
jgi:hypothetical protein